MSFGPAIASAIFSLPREVWKRHHLTISRDKNCSERGNWVAITHCNEALAARLSGGKFRLSKNIFNRKENEHRSVMLPFVAF